MSHSPKATSVDGQVMAMQNAIAPQHAPAEPLSAKYKAVWNELLARKTRDEWNSTDLRYAWMLTRILVRYGEEEKLLAKEGSVLETANGPKANPREAIVERLGNRAISFARFLRIHPGSDGRRPSQLRGAREEEKEARLTVDSIRNKPFIGNGRGRVDPRGMHMIKPGEEEMEFPGLEDLSSLLPID